jgi:hypothetical protein
VSGSAGQACLCRCLQEGEWHPQMPSSITGAFTPRPADDESKSELSSGAGAFGIGQLERSRDAFSKGTNVTEPPKLYGPHVPVIVPKTSDSYACTPDNLRRSVGCPHRTSIQLHLTTHNRINKGVTKTL